MKAYKIQNKQTGEYAVGGTRNKTSKRGKIWMGAGPLRGHLNIKRYPAETYEVIEYELTEVGRMPLEDF